MFELFSTKNWDFTEADKEACKPIIFRILELAYITRREGTLAIELEMKTEQSFFLKTAINLVADGTDPILIRQILKNIIVADKYTGSELLGRLIIAEGVLSIQQGENPQIIALKLSSMLGEKYVIQIGKELTSSGLAK